MLDQIMPDSRRFRSGKDACEVNCSASDVCKLSILIHVFHMNQGKSSRMAIEILYRLLSTLCDPIKVHLHLHQFRIGLGEQNVVWESAVERRELEIMIVIRELDSELFAGLPCAVDFSAACFQTSGFRNTEYPQLTMAGSASRPGRAEYWYGGQDHFRPRTSEPRGSVRASCRSREHPAVSRVGNERKPSMRPHDRQIAPRCEINCLRDRAGAPVGIESH